MKKLILLVCFFSAIGLNAQEFPGLDASPLDVAYFPSGLPLFELRSMPVQQPKIKLYYSRPQLKGREMMGTDAAPYGDLWRLGANEANEITFYQDVTFGDQAVKAGTYALHAIPGEKEWEFVLSSKLDTWGSYRTNESHFTTRAKTTVISKPDAPIEALSMMFKEVSGGAHLVFGWENTVVELPIKF